MRDGSREGITMLDETAVVTPEIEVENYRPLVEDLGVRHPAKDALRRLMAAGPLATTAVREGLRHDDPTVRVGCCKVLDHFMDDAALPELIANLDHDDAEVRAWALHALACDRCKEGECRPGEEDVLPRAIGILLGDRSRRVRQMAAGMVGPSVHRSDDARRALERARDHDPHPAVRKIAGWYTPGGPIFRRLQPVTAPKRKPSMKGARRLARQLG